MKRQLYNSECVVLVRRDTGVLYLILGANLGRSGTLYGVAVTCNLCCDGAWCTSTVGFA